MKLEDHPTVQRIRLKTVPWPQVIPQQVLDAGWLRRICRDAGADDFGYVAIDLTEVYGLPAGATVVIRDRMLAVQAEFVGEA